MGFKPTLTAGDILTALTILISVFGAYNRLSTQLTKLETKLDPVYQWWDRHINNGNRYTTSRGD